MMELFVCLTCNGEKEVFAGAWMHPNPYDYSSYDEIWEQCPDCNGTGRSFKPNTILIRLKQARVYRRRRYTEEVEIPF